MMQFQKTIRVEFLRNTVAESKPVKIGDKRTLAAEEALYLIGIKKAKRLDDSADGPSGGGKVANAPAKKPIDPAKEKARKDKRKERGIEPEKKPEEKTEGKESDGAGGSVTDQGQVSSGETENQGSEPSGQDQQ